MSYIFVHYFWLFLPYLLFLLTFLSKQTKKHLSSYSSSNQMYLKLKQIPQTLNLMKTKKNFLLLLIVYPIFMLQQLSLNKTTNNTNKTEFFLLIFWNILFFIYLLFLIWFFLYHFLQLIQCKLAQQIIGFCKDFKNECVRGGYSVWFI